MTALRVTPQQDLCAVSSMITPIDITRHALGRMRADGYRFIKLSQKLQWGSDGKFRKCPLAKARDSGQNGSVVIEMPCIVNRLPAFLSYATAL